MAQTNLHKLQEGLNSHLSGASSLRSDESYELLKKAKEILEKKGYFVTLKGTENYDPEIIISEFDDEDDNDSILFKACGGMSYSWLVNRRIGKISHITRKTPENVLRITNEYFGN
jgi:hypothetical protein